MTNSCGKQSHHELLVVGPVLPLLAAVVAAVVVVVIAPPRLPAASGREGPDETRPYLVGHWWAGKSIHRVVAAIIAVCLFVRLLPSDIAFSLFLCLSPYVCLSALLSRLARSTKRRLRLYWWWWKGMTCCAGNEVAFGAHLCDESIF